MDVTIATNPESSVMCGHAALYASIGTLLEVAEVAQALDVPDLDEARR